MIKAAGHAQISIFLSSMLPPFYAMSQMNFYFEIIKMDYNVECGLLLFPPIGSKTFQDSFG